MGAGDRRLACLLVTLVLALGLGGAARAGGTSADGRPVVAAVGGQSPQAVLDLHSQPRLAQHPGKAAGPPAAPAVALLLAPWWRSPRVRGAVPVPGRPACGSRAPPGISTPA